MTYQELLYAVLFDDIRPFINKYDEGENPPAKYEQHYNMLKGLPVEHPEEEIKITIKWSHWEGKETFLEAHNLEGAIWEEALGSELLIAEDVNASLAEIAMCCLWHSSFYGFTHEEEIERFQRMMSEEEKEWIVL